MTAIFTALQNSLLAVQTVSYDPLTLYRACCGNMGQGTLETDDRGQTWIKSKTEILDFKIVSLSISPVEKG